MNYSILSLLVFLMFSCNAQSNFQFSYEHFEEEFLAYQPSQRSTISKKDFDYGNMITRETKKALEGNPNNFNRADYFNVLSAFLTFGESVENIKIAFEKFKQAEGSCEYIIHFEKTVQNSAKYDPIRVDYYKELTKCQATTTPKKNINITDYAKEHDLNLNLVECIQRLNNQDQKYRSQYSNKSSVHQQKLLDQQNQVVIDSLYAIHKSYIGRSLVGDKFETVMWSIIQHSTVDLMEKYLPIVHKAVQEKELAEGPLKMLLDRFYGLKYGYQIFGSQSGFDFKLADDKTRKAIEKKYNIK